MVSTITILLRRQNTFEEKVREAKKVITQLQEKGFTDIQYHDGTTFINVPVGGLVDVPNAVNKMYEIPNLWFYVVLDHLYEVSDAIQKHEYFKTLTLCVSLYESFGKNILIRRFKDKDKLALKSVIERLTVKNVINMLYTYGIIKELVYHDMIQVNKIRNELTHSYVSSIMSDELLAKIEKHIPNVKRSLEALKQINEIVN